MFLTRGQVQSTAQLFQDGLKRLGIKQASEQMISSKTKGKDDSQCHDVFDARFHQQQSIKGWRKVLAFEE